MPEQYFPTLHLCPICQRPVAAGKDWKQCACSAFVRLGGKGAEESLMMEVGELQGDAIHLTETHLAVPAASGTAAQEIDWVGLGQVFVREGERIEDQIATLIIRSPHSEADPEVRRLRRELRKTHELAAYAQEQTTPLKTLEPKPAPQSRRFSDRALGLGMLIFMLVVFVGGILLLQTCQQGTGAPTPTLTPSSWFPGYPGL